MTPLNNIKKTVRNLKTSIFATAILVALFLVSCASPLHTLSDYDTNGNMKLNKSEFSKALEATSHGTGAFNLADADGNGAVSKNEWNQYMGLVGFDTKYDADNKGSFKKWDSDRNGSLSKKELYNGIFQTVDNGVSGDSSTFNKNIANDGFIERSEWNQWYDKDLF